MFDMLKGLINAPITEDGQLSENAGMGDVKLSAQLISRLEQTGVFVDNDRLFSYTDEVINSPYKLATWMWANYNPTKNPNATVIVHGKKGEDHVRYMFTTNEKLIKRLDSTVAVGMNNFYAVNDVDDGEPIVTSYKVMSLSQLSVIINSLLDRVIHIYEVDQGDAVPSSGTSTPVVGAE
ncbi:hypothetical protein RsoM2USA_257 [Ralstonia phage RsoM2USA]|nr:hypothetical protein RsoM2USA_257 [Ralstonia phage RsoM2USA]